jgi:hypothetical protein
MLKNYLTVDKSGPLDCTASFTRATFNAIIYQHLSSKVDFDELTAHEVTACTGNCPYVISSVSARREGSLSQTHPSFGQSFTDHCSL